MINICNNLNGLVINWIFKLGAFSSYVFVQNNGLLAYIIVALFQNFQLCQFHCYIFQFKNAFTEFIFVTKELMFKPPHRFILF